MDQILLSQSDDLILCLAGQLPIHTQCAIVENDERHSGVVCNNVEEQLNTYLFLQDIGYYLNEWEKEFICTDPAEQRHMRQSYQHPLVQYGYDDDGEECFCISTSCREPCESDIHYDDIVHLINGVLAPDEALQPPDLPGLLECFS